MKNTTLCGKILHFVVNYSFLWYNITFLWYNITFCSTFVVYLWYICDIFVVFFAMGAVIRQISKRRKICTINIAQDIKVMLR